MNKSTNEPKDSLLECANLLQQLDELLGVYEPLTGDEIRRSTRLSRRKEAAVPAIAEVCRKHGLDEAASCASVEEMLASHREARALREQLETLDLVRARLDAKRQPRRGRCGAPGLLLLPVRAERGVLRRRLA